MLDVIDARRRDDRHRDDGDAAGAERLDGAQHADIRSALALRIVDALGSVECDADEIELGDVVEAVGHPPAVGVHRRVHAARLQVPSDGAEILSHQRLAAHDARAGHAAGAQLVDGVAPARCVHLVALLQRNLAIGAAEVAAVRERQAHLEGALAPQHPARAELEQGSGKCRAAP